MRKISGANAQCILEAAPAIMRSLASERDALLEKNASLNEEVTRYRREERIRKVAGLAHNRNLASMGETEGEKVAYVREAVEQGKDLDVMEEAIGISAPNGSLGGLGNSPVGGSRDSGSALESYLRG